MVLLDTNILSEIIRPKPNDGVIAFLIATHHTTISIISLHEIAYGVEVAPNASKPRLSQFLRDVRKRYLTKALPVDHEVAEEAARMRAFVFRSGRSMTLADSLIAASAHVHSFALVTRNVKDFDLLSIAVVNPFT